MTTTSSFRSTPVARVASLPSLLWMSVVLMSASVASRRPPTSRADPRAAPGELTGAGSPVAEHHRRVRDAPLSATVARAAGAPALRCSRGPDQGLARVPRDPDIGMLDAPARAPASTGCAPAKELDDDLERNSGRAPPPWPNRD